jgi:hypothetical protein
MKKLEQIITALHESVQNEYFTFSAPVEVRQGFQTILIYQMCANPMNELWVRTGLGGRDWHQVEEKDKSVIGAIHDRLNEVTRLKSSAKSA